MGLYVKGVLGAFSGKVGNVVGSNWRSIDYLRSLPKPSKKPATQRQLAQRAKFALVMEFLSPMRDLINLGFNDKLKRKMTGFNQAANSLLNKVAGEHPNFTIPYEEVQFSKGSLSKIVLTIDIDPENNLVLSWPSRAANSATGANTDVVNFILYNESTHDYFVFEDAVRGDESYVIEAASIGEGEFHLWSVILSEKKDKRSNSKYEGTLTV